jgi:Holliday junction resolvasome RuvABC endonuclease subunit
MTRRGRNSLDMLTLDLSTHIGWSCGPVHDAQPQFGHHDLPKTGPDLGLFIWHYDKWLRRMLAEHSPDVLVFEQPVLNRQKTQLLILRKLYGLASHTEFVCRGKCAVREANNQSVKAWWTGNGRADKNDMVAVAVANGFKVQTPDEADALAVRFFAIERLYPEFAGLVTPGIAFD